MFSTVLLNTFDVLTVYFICRNSVCKGVQIACTGINKIQYNIVLVFMFVTLPQCITEDKEKEREMLQKYQEFQQKAVMYYIYHAIQRYTVCGDIQAFVDTSLIIPTLSLLNVCDYARLMILTFTVERSWFQYIRLTCKLFNIYLNLEPLNIIKAFRQYNVMVLFNYSKTIGCAVTKNASLRIVLNPV